MRLEVEDSGEMTELVRRHVDADLVHDRLGYLLGQRLLALAPTALADEQITAKVGSEAGQDLPPVPSDRLRQFGRDLEGKITPFRLGGVLRDVNDQLAFRALRLLEVLAPVQFA